MIIFGPNQCQVRGCEERCDGEYDITAQGLRLIGVRLCVKHSVESLEEWQKLRQRVLREVGAA